MKVVILAGGFGTRISEESVNKPKPMVEIGGKPILWHIMKIYETYGFNDFVIALGYKGDYIKDYFRKYSLINSDFKINLSTHKIEFLNNSNENFNVTLIDTGLNTMTGGRLFNLREALKDEQEFMLTYGDGVADVDLNELLKYHRSSSNIATLTAVRPSARFGNVTMNKKGSVESFAEKPQAEQGWINGGFFVFSSEIFNFLRGPEEILERYPLEELAAQGKLGAFKHSGFWQCMDTLRDKNALNEMWDNNKAEWKKW